MTRQALNRYSYVLNNPLTYNDPYGWWTLSFGLNFKISFFLSYSFSFSIAFDGQGNLAILETTPVSPGFQGGGGISHTFEAQWTGGDSTVSDLATGKQEEVGVSGKRGVLVSGAYVRNEEAGYEGVKLNVGLGISTPFATATTEFTKTDIVTSRQSLENLTIWDAIWYYCVIAGNERGLDALDDLFYLGEYYGGW